MGVAADVAVGIGPGALVEVGAAVVVAPTWYTLKPLAFLSISQGPSAH